MSQIAKVAAFVRSGQGSSADYLRKQRETKTSSASTPATKTTSTADRLASIRQQIESISKSISSGNLTSAQKTAASTAVSNALKQVTSLKSSSSSSTPSSPYLSNAEKKKIAAGKDKQKQIAEIQKKANEIGERINTLKEKIAAGKAEKEEVEEIEELEEERDEIVNEYDVATPSYDVATPSIETIDINIGGVNFTIPKELANSSTFKALGEQEKAMAATMWTTVVDQGQDIGRFLSALETAADQSDLYIGQHIRMFKDELARNFTELGQDLEAQEMLTSQRLQRLEEDMGKHKGDLSLDQQRELSEITKQYKTSLEGTREQISDRGLSRSSIRLRAEEKLSEARDDIVESSTTKFDRAHRDLEMEAGRQTADFQTQLDLFRTQQQRQASGLARQGEAMLGSGQMEQLLPNLGIKVGLGDWMKDDWMVGGITASKEKQMRFDDITQRTKAFLGT